MSQLHSKCTKQQIICTAQQSSIYIRSSIRAYKAFNMEPTDDTLFCRASTPRSRTSSCSAHSAFARPPPWCSSSHGTWLMLSGSAHVVGQLRTSINCSSSSMDGVTLLTPVVFSNKQPCRKIAHNMVRSTTRQPGARSTQCAVQQQTKRDLPNSSARK